MFRVASAFRAGAPLARRGVAGAAALAATRCAAAVSQSLRWQSSSSSPALDHSHVTRHFVWGLWNDGNLFSLSVPELQHFLDEHYFSLSAENAAKKSHMDTAKKSVLVRQVEELLSAEQQQQQQQQQHSAVGSVADGLVDARGVVDGGYSGAIHMEGYDRVEESFDDADEYGDWGVEPGYDQTSLRAGDRRGRARSDFLEISPMRMGERYDVLAPRSYQLLHSGITSDLALRELSAARKLPGQSRRTTPAFTLQRADVDDANRQRFKRAFEWSMLNVWNLSLTASELNINAGRVLFYAGIAKQNKNILPLYTLQKHSYAQHPYVFFSVATERNKQFLEKLATEKLGLTLTQDETTSYKVNIRHGNLGASSSSTMQSFGGGNMVPSYGTSADLYLDCELNANLNVVKINKPWDKLFVLHYVRTASPDLRFVVRARHPLKRRIADLFTGSGDEAAGSNSVLKFTRDSVQSTLSPELGEVVYCCERKIRKWSRVSERTGVAIALVETRRTPLIITKIGDEGERVEYEFVVQLPQKGERVSVDELGDEVWELGRTLATAMEEGMEDLAAYTMSAASSFA